MQKFIVSACNLYMKSGIDRKAGQTNDIKDMREYKDAMEYIENQKSSQIVKMQREEQAREEKMEELNERLRKQEEVRVIKEMNEAPNSLTWKRPKMIRSMRC